MSGRLLHQPVVDVKRAWCGPTALAAVTGEPLSAFPLPPRRGSMSIGEIERALRARGIRFEILRFARGSRLPLRRVLARIYMGHGILAVRGHYLAFAGLLVLDSWSKRPMWVYDHPLAGRKVYYLIVIRGHALAGIDPILSALRLLSAQASVRQMRAAGPRAQGER